MMDFTKKKKKSNIKSLFKNLKIKINKILKIIKFKFKKD